MRGRVKDTELIDREHQGSTLSFSRDDLLRVFLLLRGLRQLLVAVRLGIVVLLLLLAEDLEQLRSSVPRMIFSQGSYMDGKEGERTDNRKIKG